MFQKQVHFAELPLLEALEKRTGRRNRASRRIVDLSDVRKTDGWTGLCRVPNRPSSRRTKRGRIATRVAPTESSVPPASGKRTRSQNSCAYRIVVAGSVRKAYGSLKPCLQPGHRHSKRPKNVPMLGAARTSRDLPIDWTFAARGWESGQ